MTGRFQGTPVLNPPLVEPEFYSDAALIAFKTPADEVPVPAVQIKTSDGSVADESVPTDGNLATFFTIRKAEGSAKPWLQASYAQPVTIRSLTASIGKNEHGTPVGAALQASDDGKNFRTIATADLDSAAKETISLAPVKAQFFQLTFDQHGPSSEDIAVNEFALHAGNRVNRFEAKAGFRPVPDLYGFASSEKDDASDISKSDIIDLIGKLRSDGTLDWTAPPGRLDDPSHRLLPDWDDKPSSNKGSYGARGRQA